MSIIVNRRRCMGMGKSEYIEWLKSLGCICWLPLSSDGDMLDRISGKSIVLTGNGSLVWDDDMGMYIFTTPSDEKNTFVAFLDNGMDKLNFPENDLTSMATVGRISVTGVIGSFLSPLSTNYLTQMALTPSYGNTGDLSRWPDGTQKVAIVYNNNIDRKLYHNGTLVSTYSPYTPYLPQNWYLQGSGLCIGMLRNVSSVDTYKDKKIYIKDIYIFNKALTLEDIRKIQGYE